MRKKINNRLYVILCVIYSVIFSEANVNLRRYVPDNNQGYALVLSPKTCKEVIVQWITTIAWNKSSKKHMHCVGSSSI